MQSHQMDELIDAHIAAEMASDTAAAVSMYTDEVVHDVVGWPSGPVRGPEAAKDFYDQLVANFDNEQMLPTRKLYGETSASPSMRRLGPCRGRSSAFRATGGASRSACCTFGSSGRDGSVARTSGSTAVRSLRS